MELAGADALQQAVVRVRGRLSCRRQAKRNNLGYPALFVAAEGGLVAALAGQILLALGVGLYGGAAFTTMPELFPTSFRATGHALSYQTGTVIFGGTAPFVSTWLMSEFGPMAPGWYLSAIGLFGIVAVLSIPETNTLHIRSSAAKQHPLEESALG